VADIFKRFLADDSGASAIEYCLVASIIAMSIVAALPSIGSKVSAMFAQVAAAN
jgi:pilus assembly protein Flp/PilA